jgi:GNAT superfamily N-acetyltransferase
MTIRQMTINDVDFAFKCTNAEGWQSATKDCFISAMEYDPHGCFVAVENGNRIGICVAAKYINTGFIGELIVVEDQRGKGYGKRLFEKAIHLIIFIWTAI